MKDVKWYTYNATIGYLVSGKYIFLINLVTLEVSNFFFKKVIRKMKNKFYIDVFNSKDNFSIGYKL